MDCRSIEVNDKRTMKILECMRKCTSKKDEKLRHIHWDPAEGKMVATDAHRILLFFVGKSDILGKSLGEDPLELDWDNPGKVLTTSEADPLLFPEWRRFMPAKGRYLDLTGTISPFAYLAYAAKIVLDTRYEDILKTIGPVEGAWFTDSMRPVTFNTIAKDLRYLVMPIRAMDFDITGEEYIPAMTAPKVKMTYNFVRDTVPVRNVKEWSDD